MPAPPSQNTELPAGVSINTRPLHGDKRGSIAEVFQSIEGVADIRQLTLVHSVANSLRGVHVHLRKVDVVIAVAGTVEVWLRDLRAGSPTTGATACIALNEENPRNLVIPPGVAHAFYSRVPTVIVVGNTRTYEPEDDYGCHWADPELGFAWNCREPLVSDRDASAGPLAELIEIVNQRALP